MKIENVEMNLKDIKELVDRLSEEVEKIKTEALNEKKEKTYQLNIYIDKPTCYERELGTSHYDEYFLISITGGIRQEFWCNNAFDNMVYQHQILFKDKASAETYLELIGDMKRLSKKFEEDECNYYLRLEYGIVVWWCSCCQMRDYCFTEENAQYIIDKYGQEVLNTFIQYCK